MRQLSQIMAHRCTLRTTQSRFVWTNEKSSVRTNGKLITIYAQSKWMYHFFQHTQENLLSRQRGVGSSLAMRRLCISGQLGVGTRSEVFAGRVRQLQLAGKIKK
jgi:hypothetical protein